jgi:xylulose-5-phosphate/fructose-6-phosphate phosphoketolase
MKPFPGGIPSRASPECRGSIHEGGELGYWLSPSLGAAFDNPACIVGDGKSTARHRLSSISANQLLALL